MDWGKRQNSNLFQGVKCGTWQEQSQNLTHSENSPDLETPSGNPLLGNREHFCIVNKLSSIIKHK